MDLAGTLAALRDQRGPDLERAPFITVTWRRPLPDPSGPAVQVHLRVLDDGLLLVGLEREVQ